MPYLGCYFISPTYNQLQLRHAVPEEGCESLLQIKAPESALLRFRLP